MTDLTKLDRFKSLLPYIRAQFPTKHRDNESRLIDFTEAYYKFLEDQDGQPLNELAKFESFLFGDFDEEYFKLIKRDLAPDFPTFGPVSHRILQTRFGEIFRSKGRDDAVRFFFRAVFGQDVEIVYPVGRAGSDVFFNRRTTNIIRGSISAGSLASFAGKSAGAWLNGKQTGTFFVESVESKVLFGIPFDELQIRNLTGKVPGTALVKLTEDTGSVFNVIPIVSGASIVDGGTNYSTGDSVIFETAGSGIGASLIIDKVRGQIIDGNIIFAGSGYDSGSVYVEIIGDGSGATATATVSGGTITDIVVTSPGSGYTFASIFVRGSYTQQAEVSAYIRGEIVSISVVQPGIGYDTAPTFYSNPPSPPSSYGSGAQVVIRSSGTLDDCEFERIGKLPEQSFYYLIPIRNQISTFTDGETVTTSGGFSGTYQALPDHDAIFLPIEKDTFDGDLLVDGDLITGQTSGATARFEQRFSKFLIADAGDFVKDREFSYVIRSGLNTSDYESLFRKVAHVAGTEFSGEYGITNSVDNNPGTFQVHMFNYSEASGGFNRRETTTSNRPFFVNCTIFADVDGTRLDVPDRVVSNDLLVIGNYGYAFVAPEYYFTDIIIGTYQTDLISAHQNEQIVQTSRVISQLTIETV